MSQAPAEARDRLLQAWRGEILAGAVYELIAKRMQDREADILRRMAEAENGHRSRLEQRMRELEIPVPDPTTVRVPPWLRLQAGIAPVDRLLAAREAAEDEEVDDLYTRSTGDPETDRLLRDIRKEERSHSLAVADLRSGAAVNEVVFGPELTVAAPGAQARLNKILRRESWHSRGGGWISGAIYGAIDGLAAVFGIVAGVSGATGGSKSVLTAGLAGRNDGHPHRRRHLAPRPLPRRGGQVAGHAAQLVGGWARDDAGRSNRRRGDLPRRPSASDVTIERSLSARVHHR